MDVKKYGAVIPMSQEALAEARDLGQAMRRWMEATPEQREQWQREAAAKRAAERAEAQHVDLTLDALLSKLNFSREYAEHLVQPYCTCGDGYDGWERCEHASDLGLETS